MGNSNSHGARPVHQIISMLKCIRTNQRVVATPAARAESAATVRLSAEVEVDQTAREIWTDVSFCSHPQSYVSAMGQPHAHVTFTWFRGGLVFRPVHLIITMIKWIRTSRLSIKNSLS